MRIAFGDPKSSQIRARGDEEGVGEGLAARINYAIAWHRSIMRHGESQRRLSRYSVV